MTRSLLDLFGSPGAAVFVGVILKATLVLLAGATLATLLRKASASARHLVWALVLASCAAIVAFAPVAPELALAIPQPAALAVEAASRPASSPNAFAGAIPPSVSRVESTFPDAHAAREVRPFALSPMNSISLANAVVVVWLTGLFVVLGWCAFGHLALRRVRRSSRVLDRADWMALRARCAAKLGITSSVALSESDLIRTPVTWGLRHPIVVLPSGASEWTEERKRVVLLHEMAHIARLDYASQLVGTIASALFWFHPGVWLAARRLRVEAERACDDAVLDAGLTGVAYAAHLLDVARRMRPMRLIGPAAVGMARPSQLEERLLAVLTSLPSRRPVRSRVTRVAIATTLLAIVPLAGITPRLVAAAPAVVTQVVEKSTAPVAPAPVADPSPRAAKVIAPAAEHPDTTTSVTPPARKMVAEQAFDFEDSVSASPEGELDLDLRTGASLDILGWDKPWVRVRGTLGGPDAYRTRVSLASTERGGARLRSALEKRGGRSSSTSHRFEIRVPKKFSIRLSSAGGGVTLNNLVGEFRGNTGGGPLTLEGLTGHANLSTGGGDIHVSSSDLSGRVNTGGGAVVLSAVKGGLRGSSGSGPVMYSTDKDGNAELLNNLEILGERLKVGASGSEKSTGQRVPGGVVSRDMVGLFISKAGGGIDLAEAPEGGTLQTGGGRIRVGQSSGVIDATTGGGDIELGAVAGSAYASTGAGDVHITVVDVDGQEHSVDVSSGKGNVVIELPANLNARFELETAYTDNYRGKTKITSDFTLERDETTEWDDRYGTPRKFVRAFGEVGRGGAGLIRVQTVNGNITVRRTR